MCNKSRAIQILAEANFLCGQIFGDKIRDAYLCGSYARGDFDDENDVDILIDIRTGRDYDDFFAIAKDNVE